MKKREIRKKLRAFDPAELEAALKMLRFFADGGEISDFEKFKSNFIGEEVPSNNIIHVMEDLSVIIAKIEDSEKHIIGHKSFNVLQEFSLGPLTIEKIFHFVMTPEDAEVELDVIEGVRSYHDVRFGARYAKWRYWTWGISIAGLAIVKKFPLYKLYHSIVDRIGRGA